MRWFAGVLAAVALHVTIPAMAAVTANTTGCGAVAVIAHRGEPVSRPEETLPSFEQASWTPDPGSGPRGSALGCQPSTR